MCPLGPHRIQAGHRRSPKAARHSRDGRRTHDITLRRILELFKRWRLGWQDARSWARRSFELQMQPFSVPAQGQRQQEAMESSCACEVADRPTMGDRNAQAMPGGHGLSQPGHVVTGRGDQRLRGVAAVTGRKGCPARSRQTGLSDITDKVPQSERPGVSEGGDINTRRRGLETIWRPSLASRRRGSSPRLGCRRRFQTS